MTAAQPVLERAQPELVRLRLWILAAIATPPALVICVLLIVASGGAQLVAMLLSAVWIAAVGIAAWRIRLGLRHYGFMLLDDGLLLQSGVWWRSEVFVPRVRIQHTDVAQGPLARKLDLATLVLHTAGVKTAQLQIDGLRPARAYQLRDELLVRQPELIDTGDNAADGTP